jgi:hypothetical protein
LRIFSPNFFRKENDKSENFLINPINTFLVDLRFFSITGKVNLARDPRMAATCPHARPPCAPLHHPDSTPRTGPRLQQEQQHAPSSLTSEDRHYSDRSPPPQRGVAAFPSPRRTCTTHHIRQHPVPRSLASPRSMPLYFLPTAIDGHRSSWSSKIFAQTAFPRL